MRPLARQEGSALISAIILMTVILGLGMGLLLFTDNQQKASAREQWSEQAFNVAEAALNAQVGQLSRVWPTVKNSAPGPESVAVTRCTEGVSNGKNYCPPTIPLSVGYGKLSHVACPAGTPTEAWGSPITNQWTTYVRSAAPSSTYFNSHNEEGALDYAPPEEESKGVENKLWVRAVGVVNCHFASLVTLVSRQVVSVPFPKDVLGGNWFAVTNNGNHGGEPVVKDNFGAETGEIGMRCEGKTAAECEEYNNGTQPGHTPQIQPSPVKAPNPPPSPLLTEEQLAAVRSLAETKGTLMSPTLGNCPTSMAQLSGTPAYVEGCGNITVTTGTANAPPPNVGFLVMAEGQLKFTGNGTFYGVIYSRNPTNIFEPAMVIVGGGTTIEGAIEVDGKGGIDLGANGVNLIYNPEPVLNLKGAAGATPTRNTFRVLPVTQ